MAAHVTGDAGVDAVLDAFEAAQTRQPVRTMPATPSSTRTSSTPETAARAARLGVLVDTQPAWFYKDADALSPRWATAGSSGSSVFARGSTPAS